MKTVLGILVLSFIGVSALAKKEALKKVVGREPAMSWLRELSPDSAQVLSVLSTSCPEKLAELMQEADAVGKVFYGEKTANKITQRMWQITAVRRTPPPFISETPVATLVIDWQTKPEEGPQVPDRGSQWEVKCSIQKRN